MMKGRCVRCQKVDAKDAHDRVEVVWHLRSPERLPGCNVLIIFSVSQLLDICLCHHAVVCYIKHTMLCRLQFH